MPPPPSTRTRFGLLLAGFALVAAACGGAGIAGNDEPAKDAVTNEVAAGGAFPRGPSALREDADSPDLPDPLVDVTQIISGGPPPDGIPPIDEPAFVSIAEADEYLAGNEPVVRLEIDGDVRAYPVQILMWHEIVNDTVGGVPVSVTYCPLCNSAVSYVREIDGSVTTFGTSGRLFNSALVMYDRATESLWTHYDGRAVAGVLTGTELEPVPSPLIAWADFKDAHPEALVLDRDSTGFTRRYGSNPYVGYDDVDTRPFLFRGDVDDRAALKQRVVGVTIGEASKAWPLEAISGGEARATAGALGESDIVIFWKAGQSSALDASGIDDGRDVGSVAVFDPTVDGRVLTFSAAGDKFLDAETGSEWGLTGRAVAGELEGTKLAQINHLDTFWFAWSSYRPGTELAEVS